MSIRNLPYSERIGSDQRLVAVGLLTERDLAMLGEGFRRAFRLGEDHDFNDLLAAIDAAERASKA